MTDLWRMSGTQIADAVRARRLSATEVIKSHIARLQSVNPMINAVVQEFPDEALAEAKLVDDQIARGHDPGPLCGVPVTIKVNIDQKGHATTNGLKLLKHNIADFDSPVVSNIRKAGGIIVGRTNTPAFSLRWFTKNDLHGQTLNPRNASITPGGSSGGAAAAVAAGLCAVGQGTDIAGSIRYPAYACGLHGLRPSLGRVPAYNASAPDRHIGAQIMAVSGPIARRIDDIRISLAAMSGADTRDPWHCAGPLDQGVYVKRAALSVTPDGMSVAPEVTTALTQAATTLRASGWQIDEVDCPPMRKAARVNATLWMAETQFAARDMIARENEPDAMFVFEQMSRDIGEVGYKELMTALQDRVGLIREWAAFHEDYPLLICPISGALPFVQQSDVRSEADFRTIYEAQLTQVALPAMGLPALAVATAPVGNIPMGIQLVSGRFREDILLDAGAIIEAAGPLPGLADPF